MIRLLYTLIIILSTETLYAQNAYFSSRGKISYDKITYTRARMRDLQKNINQGGKERGGMSFNLDNIPESNTEKYLLTFDEQSTLMRIDQQSNTTNQETNRGPGRGAGMGGGNRGGQASIGGSVGFGTRGGGQTGGGNARANTNSKVLFQNLKTKTSEVQIEIDDKYIITDSLNDITWRFSDEYRNIAGYECRRINGATKDSLYVIAFYTDEIPVSAGPALTSGLPGMILGLVIPEMHIQYWATKVEYSNELVNKDWKDKKAKQIKINEFVNTFGRIFQRGRDSNSNKRQVQEQLIY